MEDKSREAGMMAITGAQGVGKTYLNMHIIKDYVTDNFKTKVNGRKCLILDTNGEYTNAQFKANKVNNLNVKLLSLKDVPEWSRFGSNECRRIDAKNLGLSEKKKVAEYCIKNYKNGMFVLEDINTYLLNVAQMEEIVGGLVNLRHRAVDVLISYQSLRAVEPRIWQNSRWIRMHYQADNVSDIKGKVNNPELMKIAQLIINSRYFNGDQRFYLYIYNLTNKIVGDYNKEEFLAAARQYLSMNKKLIKEVANMNKIPESQAIERKSNQLYEIYGQD